MILCAIFDADQYENVINGDISYKFDNKKWQGMKKNTFT